MRATVLPLPLLLGLVACGGDAPPASTNATASSPTPTSEGSSTPTPEGVVTWYGGAEPIVREHCVSCHQDGGAGGFPLTTAEEAAPWAHAMADAVTSGRMPPWLVTDDGTCQDWADSRGLDADAIDTLVTWADDGAWAGDPADGVSEPLPAAATLARVDRRLDTPEIVPEIEGDLFAPNDEYRCFVFKDVADHDTFITGFQVDPGFDAIVHHVIGMPVDPEGPGWTGFGPNGETIDAYDGADGRPGWDCLGTAGDGIRESGYPVTWAPGMGAVHYPEGTGVKLDADDWFVVQVHYNLIDPANRDLPDSTGIELRLDDTVEHELHYALVDGLIDSVFTGGFPDTIPPGEEAYDYTFARGGDDIWYYAGMFPGAVGSTDYRLWGVMPHMHQRGRQLVATLVHGDGTRECLTEVPRWDFEWQLTYLYESPLTLSFSDTLEVTCTYDTRDDEHAILPGWGTDNEMCLLVMMISK